MKLDKQQVEHVANLARLQLSAKEIKQYTEQLSTVLDYVDQLQEVDTNKTKPCAQITGLVNAWREDEVGEHEINKDLENKQIKVNKVL